mmetsp:Transcript_46918/g.106229  ORF Transcript_46918/g.106229 Transcript_46918/m.106229 type:complete len:1074 (-) Transcript_46918:242-3463(-)
MIAHEYGNLETPKVQVHKFGGRGGRLGWFDKPTGACAVSVSKGRGAERTYIAVSEAGNQRVQVMRNDGSFVRFVGREGKSGTNLVYPTGCDFGGAEAMDPGLAVADRDQHRVQIFPSCGERECGEHNMFGRLGEVGTAGKSKRTAGSAPPGDYNGYLTANLEDLRLNKPGGVCWVEGDEGHNWLVVADTGNNRLQLLDLDSGVLRVLCGRERVVSPSMVAYHNGWRWCKGTQSSPPPPAVAWKLPTWFKAYPGGPDGDWCAEELYREFEREKIEVEVEFERQQELSGGKLSEEDLGEMMEALYGNFRVWRRKGRMLGPGKREELVLGVLTKELALEAVGEGGGGGDFELFEVPIVVQRTVPDGLVDKFVVQRPGKPEQVYSDLYLLLRASTMVATQRWRLPKHRRFLAVAEPGVARVGILEFYPPQHGSEFFPAFVRSRANAGGRELPGLIYQDQFDRPAYINMSPYGDLAIGDHRAGAKGGPRVVVYNVVTGAVSQAVGAPFLPPPVEGEPEGADQVDGLPMPAPILVPAILPSGALFAVAAGSCEAFITQPPNPPEGRAGPFLSRLPPSVVNHFVLPHLTYRNAEMARVACRYLHDWTRARRGTWELWPLHPLGLKRIRKSFVDWARLGDGRRLMSQHPPLTGEGARPLCERFLLGRCPAGELCNKSHTPPEVDESVIFRDFEEKVFVEDARNCVGGAVRGISVNAINLEIGYVELNTAAQKSGVVAGWKVIKVGSRRVSEGKELADAMTYYSQQPEACDGWGSDGSEAKWSARRPVKVTCQDFQPKRPYFSVVEWGGGFACACSEYFGLKWWWAHEPQIRELFFQKASAYVMDERRDGALRGLDTECVRTEARKPFPTPALGYPQFVELMTLLTEVRFELTSFRRVFRALLPPPPPSHPIAGAPGSAGLSPAGGRGAEKGAPGSKGVTSKDSVASSLTSVGTLPTLAPALKPPNLAGSGLLSGSWGSLDGPSSGSLLSAGLPLLAAVYGSDSVTTPVSFRDGKPVRNPNKPANKPAIKPSASLLKSGDISLPNGSDPPDERGLGLGPLETHIATFDFQNRRLDAALSNLF